MRSLRGKNWQDRDKADKVSILFPRETPKDNGNIFGGVIKKFKNLSLPGDEKRTFVHVILNYRI